MHHTLPSELFLASFMTESFVMAAAPAVQRYHAVNCSTAAYNNNVVDTSSSGSIEQQQLPTVV